jgi:hypothetical protein
MSASDAALAGELVRLALTPRSNPITDPVYREALEAYLSRPAFREMVHGLAHGLGLRVVEGTERGLIVAPVVDSLFGLPGREFRTRTPQDRVLDGLFLLATITACYPRAADLADDPRIARSPITLSQIERVLREAAERVAAQAPAGDATPEEQEAGLEPAWRELRRLPEVAATADGRAAARTSKQRIKKLLDRLTELGAFTLTTVGGEDAWQPTYRWQVQIQEYAATALWDEIQRVFGSGSVKEVH